MRFLTIATLSLMVALPASAQGYMQHPKRAADAFRSPSPASGSFSPLPGSEPYKSRAPVSQAVRPVGSTKPIGSTQPLGGSDGFKPFKPTSVYSNRGGLDPYKKFPKTKSVYDR